MKYTPKQYAEALHQVISETAPAGQDKVLDNFAALLREDAAFGLMDEIEKEYLRLSGIRTAEVTSASPLGSREEAAIIERLNAYVGGKVELRKKVDEGILGGVVIRMDDELLDGSVRKNLNDLKKELAE